MNRPQMLATPDRATAGQEVRRLPWTAPVLGVYDAARLTLGSSDQNAENGVNTHS